MSLGVQLDNISYQAGAKVLFQSLSFALSKNSRLGIVGPNGSGKSTLLKIIAGHLEPESGRVITPAELRMYYVPQLEQFDLESNVLDIAIKRLEAIYSSKDAQVIASRALTQIGITDLGVQPHTLSGGWRKRLSLAIAFASDPQILLLDEPTNHLDLDGLIWLEETLKNSSFGWAVVSHDRYFLEQSVDSILEISPLYPNGTFQSQGSYLYYKENKENFLEQESKRLSSLANIAKREKEWASRSPSARTGKAAFRMKNAEKLQTQLSSAKARQEQTQKLTGFQSSERATRELVKLIKCSFSYDSQQIVSSLTLEIPGRSCLGLLGANGQGKSTLLKLIGGELQPNAGKIKHAPNLKIVYFDQLRDTLKEWRTLGELLGEGYDHVVYQGKPVHIAGWGKRFGFSTDDHPKALANLSGGEQARALLSILVRQEADLLLLDEPTNDLDIGMLELLENMILEFSGAIVLVSHDRFLLDEVCTKFLGYTPDGNLELFASFEQWHEALRNFKKADKKEQKSTSTSSHYNKSTTKTKMSYKEAREFATIEEDILHAEENLQALESTAALPESHDTLEKSQQIAINLEEAKKRVEELYMRWEYLEKIQQEISKQKMQ